MKKLGLLIFLLLAASVTAHGQVIVNVATAIRGGGTLPSTCRPATSGTRADVFVKSGSGAGLYYCSAPNTWTAVGGGGGGSPGGSNTQVQYNNAGAFGGITGVTTDGTTLTLVAPILGTPASVTLTNATGLPPTTGISGWPSNSSGVLTNDGAGNLTWGAGGGSPGGSSGEFQFNNSSSFGGTAGLVYGATNSLVTAIDQTGTDNIVSVVRSGLTPPLVAGSPSLLMLGDTTGSFYHLGYYSSSDAHKWANYLSAGSIEFDAYDLSDNYLGSTFLMDFGGLSFNSPTSASTFYPLIYQSDDAGVFSLGRTDDFALTGAVNDFTWGARGITQASPATAIADGDIPLNHLHFYLDEAGDAIKVKAKESGGTVLTATLGGSGITIGTTAIASGTATRLLYETAGNVVGEISGVTSDGASITALPVAGVITQTSSSATAFESGPNGGTNPVFRLVNSTASSATGLSVTGNAAGSGVTLTALSSGTNELILIRPKGSSSVQIQPLNNTGSAEILGIYEAAGNVGIRGRVSSAIGEWLMYASGSATVSVSAGSGMRVGSGLPYSFATTPTGSTVDVSFERSGTNTVRLTNGGVGATGAGNLLIGTSSGAIGTSGAGVLAFTLSTAPTTSPTDTVQLYSGDSAAGAHNLFSRNEAGEVNRMTGLSARNSAQFDKTTDTTLANITGLSRNLEASRVYAFRAVIRTTAAATGGIKLAVSGTATMTNINYEGTLFDAAAVVAQTRATALDTTVCASTTATAGTCVIEGAFTVNAAGTFTIQFAQNNSDGSASSVLVNSTLNLFPIS